MIMTSHALALHNRNAEEDLATSHTMSIHFLSNAIVHSIPVMPWLHFAVQNDRQQSGDGKGLGAKGNSPHVSPE